MHTKIIKIIKKKNKPARSLQCAYSKPQNVNITKLKSKQTMINPRTLSDLFILLEFVKISRLGGHNGQTPI